MRPSILSMQQALRKTIPQSYKFITNYTFPAVPSRLSTPDIISTCTSCCEAKFPDDKQLDFAKQLNGTKAAHWKHVLIHSKVKATEWESKVELMPGEIISEFAKYKRKVVNPHYPVLISNIEVPPPEEIDVTAEEALVLVYPDNKYYKVKQDQVEQFMQSTLTPTPSHTHQDHPDPAFPAIENKNELALICGHVNRDIRCGVISEFLSTEFKYNLKSRGLLFDEETNKEGIKVGLISHIGGHAYAGNVLFFDKEGLSLWYGRVLPNHVDSIVEESVVGDSIITELYRGSVPGYDS